MAKDQSFDIVSEVDMQEVDNAYGQARKELAQRYDLKGSGAKLEFERKLGAVTITAPSDFVCKQVRDILETRLIRRKVDLKSLSWGAPQDASGGTVKTVGTIVQGIDEDTARRINKDIKGLKLKAKVQIEGTKLRVSSPSRDTLQEVITFLRDQDYGVPLQYVNYR